MPDTSPRRGTLIRRASSQAVKLNGTPYSDQANDVASQVSDVYRCSDDCAARLVESIETCSCEIDMVSTAGEPLVGGAI